MNSSVACTYIFHLVLEASEGMIKAPLLRQKFAVFGLFRNEGRLDVLPLDQRIGQIALLLEAPGEQQHIH